jgi:hypothetical protein
LPVFRVVLCAQVADVVEQGGDDSKAKEGCTEPFPARFHALVPVHQPCHGQRHVEHVLDVVIGCVAGVIVAAGAAVQRGEIGECPVDRAGGRAGIQLDVNPRDLVI